MTHSFPTRRASDLQDAFARLAGVGRLTELANPPAYLQRIARNLLADRARNRHAREAFVPLEDWDAEAAPAQDNALVAGYTLRPHEEAIDVLPTSQRMGFLLQRAEPPTQTKTP